MQRIVLLVIASAAVHAQSDQRIPRQTVAAAALIGIIRNPAGLGLGGVQIELRSESGTVLRATTSGDGSFRFVNVPPGRYQFAAELPGFEPFRRADVSVRAGEVFAIEASLRPIPKEPAPSPEPSFKA